MHKQSHLSQKVMHGALAAAGLASESSGTTSVLAFNVTPHRKLFVDHNGFTVHHGIASGGQVEHSYLSKLKKGKGGRDMLEIKDPASGKSIELTATGAEVMFAQLLPRLAASNQDADTTATS